MQASVVRELRAIIKRGLLAEADPVYLKSITALVPTDSTIMGVRVPKIRQRVVAFRKAHPQVTPQQAIALLDLAFVDNVREEVLFDIFLLAKFKRHFPSNLWQVIGGWIKSIENWEVCDQLAMNIAGEILAKDMSLMGDLLQWAQSPHLWRRRFALATAAVLNQKGRSFPEETLRVCAEVMTDEESMVQKANGWAIREASKQNPNLVFAFLNQWKSKISRSLLREASQKLGKVQKADLLA